MDNIYITHQSFKKFPEKTPKKPRERYIQLYRDLHKRFDEPLSEETFMEGSQYSYTELGEGILDEVVKNQELKKIDLMVIATWAHEFDPDYASCGTYLSERYGITGKIMDVSDQGTLAPLSAIHLISRYLKNNLFSAGLLLVLEQNTVPRWKGTIKNKVPNMNAALALLFEKSVKSKPSCPRLMESGLYFDTGERHMKTHVEIRSNGASCIEPLLYLDKPTKSRIARLVVSDVESKEQGYLIWEGVA